MDPLRISMLGLSRWESEFVQTTVNLASGMDIAPWRCVDDPTGADVLLVDADRPGFEKHKDCKDSRRPIVVSFCQDAETTSAGTERGLTRPVGYTELIAMLKDIEHELNEIANSPPSPEEAPPPEAPAETEEVPVLQEPASQESVPVIWEQLFDRPDRSGGFFADRSRPARRFVEGTRLLGLLKSILQWRSPAEVTHARFPTILVFPEQNAFLCADDPTSIPRMSRDSALSFNVRELGEDAASAALSMNNHKPLSRLIYCAALFGSEGRLLLHSNPQDALRLIDWPDFDAVPHLPEHRDIAKFMLINAASLSDIAESTDISIGIVIDFCNACEAVGLLRRLPAGSPGPVGGNTEKGSSPLLGRVRNLFRES